MRTRSILATLVVLPFICLVAHPAIGQDVSMQLVEPQKGWAIDNSSLFWTIDNGEHWRNITPQASGLIADVSFLDPSTGWVLFSDPDQQSGTISFSIARTTNSGTAWAVAAIQIPSQKPGELDGHGWLGFADATHGWLVLRAVSSSAMSWGLLLATTDGGASWTEMPQSPIAGRPVFVTAQDGWISGNSGPGGVYVTHDGAKTWQNDEPDLRNPSASLPTRASYGDVRPVDDRHAYLPVWLRASSDNEETKGTAFVVFASEDRGKTWRQDRLLADRGALSKTGAALSRIGPAGIVPGSGEAGMAVVLGYNDRQHPQRATLMSMLSQGESTTDRCWGANSDGVLWRQGDDLSALSFVTPVEGWARTSLGDLLLTRDGGKSWEYISPNPVPRPTFIPGVPTPRAKPRRTGAGASLFPPSPQAGLNYTERLGFDEHNVATTATMGTWFSMSPFFYTGIYVGGANYCGKKSNGVCVSRPDPNLTSLWITQMEGQGWGFLPIWVGPQAPCVNASGLGKFTSANAATLGAQNADSASSAMAALGLADTVVFYDMEGYSSSPGDACSVAVRAFLNAWVQEMNVDGFQTTAVYGNPGNAQNDFSQISGLTQAWIAATPPAGNPPRVTIWGLGSGLNALSDGFWPSSQRGHQFLINVGSPGNFVTYGGVNTGLSIDYDMENFLIPGAQGTKPYIWTTNIVDVSGLPNVAGAVMSGINDVVGYNNPSFVSAGQLAEAVGTWGSTSVSPPCMQTGIGNCPAGFIDVSGAVSSFVDPSGPYDTVVGGMNDAGQVVGYYCYGSGGNCGSGLGYTNAAFIGNPATSTYTTVTFAAGGFNQLVGTNDDGQAVGTVVTCNSQGICGSPSPELYSNGEANPLFITCSGSQKYFSNIVGINGYAQIAGTYVDGSGSHAFVYDYESTTGLGTCITVGLPGETAAYAINNQGQLLVATVNGFELMDGSTFYPLPQSSTFLSITGINDAAQITGTAGGSSCTYYCPFILNPE